MIDLKTLQELRQELKQKFLQHNIESPEADAGLLLMHFLNLTKTQLLTQNPTVTARQEALLFQLANRRIQGEPVHYLIGSCPFLDLEFYVNSSTLIPRPETELLVEEVARRLSGFSEPITLWDIGCGSGCIGISLAHLLDSSHVIELDISKDALQTAEKTAKKYGLQDRICFVEHDILSGMPKDLPNPQAIVSNPPYIPHKDIASLQTEVRDFEPIMALDGGNDGLNFYRRIIAEAPLSTGGLLAYEIGYDQGPSVVALMQDNGYQKIELLQDLSGLDRIVLGYR